MSVNDVVAQAEFNTRHTHAQLRQWAVQVERPDQLLRLLIIQQHRLSYQLVRAGELCKIGLTDQSRYDVGPDFIESGLLQRVTRDHLAEAIARPLENVVQLLDEAITQAQCQPDIIYVTGGTAQSPVIAAAIQARCKQLPMVIGDHLGSVTAGLTKWAAKIFN